MRDLVGYTSMVSRQDNVPHAASDANLFICFPGAIPIHMIPPFLRLEDVDRAPTETTPRIRRFQIRMPFVFSPLHFQSSMQMERGM